MTKRKLTIVNPMSKIWRTSHYRARPFILWFGECHPTYLLAYATSLEDALEECADWIAENAPGLFCDEVVHEEYDRCRAEGMEEEAAWEEATVDTTSVCSGTHHLTSYEWGIAAEDPSPKEISDFVHRRN